MIVFSFDCAIKNFGICCVKVNMNWKNEVSIINEQIENIIIDFNNKKISSNEFITITKQKLNEINNILNNVFKILFVNKVDISADKCIGTKTLLKDLEKIATPDVVLIENQWCINDKSKAVAHYIEMFYADIDSSYVIYAIPFDTENRLPEKKTIIKTIQPSLKNCFDMDKSYTKESFKKMASYRANKKHSVVNFKYYCQLFKHKINIKKIDDIADAFMMFYGYYYCNI